MQHTQPLPSPDRRRGSGSLVGAALLIGLGLLLLGQNFGLVDLDIWGVVWRLWPLALVLAGIELIFGRRSWVSLILALTVMLAVLAAVFGIAGPMGMMTHRDEGGWTWGAGAPVAVERVEQPLDGVRQATVRLDHGAGLLRVGALPAESAELIQADLSHSSNVTVTPDIQRNGDAAAITISSDAGDGPDFRMRAGWRNDWLINLSTQAATTLDVHSGASDVTLDLRLLPVTRLNVEAGASSLKITLPASAGNTEAQIKAGAAGVEITVPDGVAARINEKGGLSGTSIDQSRFPWNGLAYQSPDFDTAENRVDLRVETGVSGLTIR